MSRTYRHNSSRPLEYMLDMLYEHDGWSYRDLLWIPVHVGGWTEAKRQLSKQDFARLRRKRGDCRTKDSNQAGIPWFYRHEIEKSHRHHTARELHHYSRNPDYEVMVNYKPDGAGWWYW